MNVPYIPLYIDDFDGATAHLTPEEEGIYMRLLKLSWRTPGCSLPNDIPWIARKVRVSEADFRRVGEPVLREFFSLIRGRWTQRRLKKEWDKLACKIRERSKAGRAGGVAKALKTAENSPGKRTVLLKQPEPEPEPVNTLDKSNGADAPKSEVWRVLTPYFTATGAMDEKKARALIGRLLKQSGDDYPRLLAVHRAALAAETQDPISYFAAALRVKTDQDRLAELRAKYGGTIQ